MCEILYNSLECSGNPTVSCILEYHALLMCLKDFEESEIEIEKSAEMEKSVDCPLCLEALEFDDKNFYPCACGYQVCRFCWHRIRTNENCLCPACRRIYSENPANFQPLTPEELQKVKHQKKMKDLLKKQKIAENRKTLSNIRVIQKNLVFAVGLPLELSQDNQKKEKVIQLFRQFGPTHKEAITDRTSYAGSQGPSACVYITYQKPEDAVRAVKSLTNTKIEGRTIKVSLGTTKYCSNFLKNVHCPKTECLYLHEIADEEASFTKEDIHGGKHLDYEQKLLEQTLNSISNKVHSPSNENSRTNYNRNVDNSSESSDDLPQNSSFYDSSEASELSPPQNLENNRSIDSDFNLETENNHQNICPPNQDSRNDPDSSSNLPVFRSEESIIINNHSANSSFPDPLKSNMSPGFNNHMLKEREPLQQSSFLQKHIYDIKLQNRGQSPSSSNESSFLRYISTAAVTNNDTSNLYPNILNMKQEHHIAPNSKKRDDDPDLEFDPCQESLNALHDLVISEDKARFQFSSINRSPLSHKPSSMPVHHSPDSLGYRNSYSQPLKIKDPPPGFTNNYPQNMYKSPFEAGNSIINKSPIPSLNPMTIRQNFPSLRYPQQPQQPQSQQPGIWFNNAAVADFSPQISRDVQDIHPLLQQQQQQQQHHQQQQQQQQQQHHHQQQQQQQQHHHHQQHNQRFMNIPQAQFPVAEQRSSPLWNNLSQWRPGTENTFFNHESQATRDYNLRMQLRNQDMRQWQQPQVNGNVQNPSPFSDADST